MTFKFFKSKKLSLKADIKIETGSNKINLIKDIILKLKEFEV